MISHGNKHNAHTNNNKLIRTTNDNAHKQYNTRNTNNGTHIYIYIYIYIYILILLSDPPPPQPCQMGFSMFSPM